MNINLSAIDKFLTEKFGAVTFYNDPADGYVNYGEGREVETLAAYFPNALDLENAETAARLKAKAGDKFFERYAGADGLRVCGLAGSKIFAAYNVNGRTVAIVRHGALALKGNLHLFCDYLCGNARRAGDAFNANLTTNDGDDINAGTTFEELARKFLCKAGMPAFTPENAYFFAPIEEFKTKGGAERLYPYEVVIRRIVAGQFAQNRVADIASSRQAKFVALMKERLLQDDCAAYATDMNYTHK